MKTPIARHNLEKPIMCSSPANKERSDCEGSGVFVSKRRVASLRSPPLLIAVVNRKNLPTDHDEVTIYLNPQKINPLLGKKLAQNGNKCAGDACLL